jgi:hypothetical protein
MYGLSQAGKLAHHLLQERLAKHTYAPIPNKPGLWKHTARLVIFTLIIDDFRVKYIGREHAELLKNEYWKGALYCSISLDWDYTQGTVQLSMPNYIQQALHNFQHDCNMHHTHGALQHTEPKFNSRRHQTIHHS